MVFVIFKKLRNQNKNKQKKNIPSSLSSEKYAFLILW